MKSGIFQAETWKLALDALRSNKVRALLTMLGVIIGSACIVLVVTVALAGKRYVIGQIEGVGSNLVIAEMVNPGSEPLRLADEINPGDLEAVKREIPEVMQAAGTHDIPMTVVVGGREHVIRLVGVTDGFQQIRHLVISGGRYFEQDDLESRNKECLITYALAKEMFPNGDAVGKEIRVGDLQLTVIGVFRERVSTFDQSEITSESVLIPFPLIESYTAENYFMSFYAAADNPEDVPYVTEQVRSVLKNRHRPEARYAVQNLTGMLDAARRIAMALTVVLVVIALIALTISGIGIMNIMLVTVTERTREIGIRKAVGAPRDAILYQFLLEAFLISGTGALTGILIAVSIPALINFVIGFLQMDGGVSVPVSWESVVLAFVVSCSTGLIFGYLPASRAARLQPTESLRHE